MQVEEYKGELEELYRLWREVAKERENSLDKSKEEFKEENLNAPVGKIKCFTAWKAKELVGASLLTMRPKDASPYMNLLVPENRLESNGSKRLLEKSIEFCRKNGESEVQLSPKLYPEGFLDFFKEQGFEKDEEYPSGLWMKKELVDLDDLQIPEGIEIFETTTLGGKISAEGLAEVQSDYANSNYDLEDISAEIEMVDDDREILYSIARLEDSGEVVGFSRTMFLDLLSGNKIAQNSGLVVKKNQRNKGIGGALLIDSFHGTNEKGYDEMYISTHSNNPAKRLYKRLGFKLVREHPQLRYEIK
ncbi:MAG: N-acetyltransferase family protein [Thermoplasmata archaeon]